MGTIRYTDQIKREKKRKIDENMGKPHKKIKLNTHIKMTTKYEVHFPEIIGWVTYKRKKYMPWG